MDNRKIIILAVVLLIIAGAVVVMIMNYVPYERIEITPNGTNIEVPANQTKYQGDFESIKIWNWNNGIMATYNSHEDPLKLSGLGFDAANKIIKNGEMQNIDGFTCYVINADELLEIHIFDIIKVNYNGKFYCIPITNESTQDNIIICCNNRDIALHMAKSIEYKNVYPNTTDLDNAISTIENMTGDLQSKADEYANSTDLNNALSTIEDKAGDLQSKANDYLKSSSLNDAKSSVERLAGDLLFKIPIQY